MAYYQTLNRVENYFDQTATKTWEQLTSDAPVSRIRRTVRTGRDQMRSLILSRLPEDLSGCGTGMMTEDLARRGATVLAVDISPSLISIAEKRLPANLRKNVKFSSGDMLDPVLGEFDFVLAMDSLIYYGTEEVCASIVSLGQSPTQKVIFTVAPRTKLLILMWYLGKLFPRSDRSPVMVPHSLQTLINRTQDFGNMRDLGRIVSGFYISQAMEFSV